MHCTLKTNEKQDILTRTTDSRSTARETRGFGVSGLPVEDAVTGSGPEASCEDNDTKLESMTDTSTGFTRENVEKLTKSNTDERLFEQDTGQAELFRISGRGSRIRV